MLIALATIIVAAAGWGLLTYFATGSIGLALLVFIVLKVIGK